MQTAKKFDCVKMKNEIQEKLAKECEGLSDEEIRERTQRRLATSDSPIAKLWRSLGNRGEKEK